ncbi:hypothetical protein KBI33_02945 [Candidatus Shapirobacteria bacterium]|nr:hypothetical protein [Candidatus Shapirobacteria bacterium]
MKNMVDNSLTGLPGKEREERTESLGGERVPIIEVGREPEVAPETGIEKLEKEQHVLPAPVLDDQTGQVLVFPPAPVEPEIILPLTAAEYQIGLEAKIEDSLRWLAEWSRRLMKLLGEKVGFRRAN